MKQINENEIIEEFIFRCEMALEVLETQIDVFIREYEYINKHNPVDHVKTRLKSKNSAIEKLEKKGYEVSVSNLIKHIHDMIGIRIICSFISDVYDIVNGIKKSNKFIIKDEKNYVENPKETGYISYHIIVSIPISLNEKTEYVDAEIQIRTKAMDFWATIDHQIQYKFSKEIPEEVANEMYKCSIDVRLLDEKMNKLNEMMKKYNNDNIKL